MTHVSMYNVGACAPCTPCEVALSVGDCRPTAMLTLTLERSLSVPSSCDATRPCPPLTQIALKVNKLSTVKTLLSYDYYSLDFCPPADGVQDAAENLGEYLTGQDIQNSPYELYMLRQSMCNVLCRRTLDRAKLDAFIEKVDEEYYVNWIVDNLPAAYQATHTWYARGFPLGYSDPETGEKLLFNHHNITIEYHATDDGYRIVGFVVQVHSVKHQWVGPWNEEHPELTTCQQGVGLAPNTEPMFLAGEEVPADTTTMDVVWTYDVKWAASSTKWASRWDIYLSMGDLYSDQVHWFALVNAIVIVLFLTGMVAMIMVRALYKDLSRYNRVATDEEKAEDREDTGWKLVHADVFRPPAKRADAFVVIIGISTQVLGMTVLTLVFAAIGFLSPANRGSLMLALLLLFLCMGAVAGYSAARTHKMFNGTAWQRTTLATALLFPSFVFGVLFFLNLFVWAEGSSNAVPFGSMVAVLALWLLISIPLVFVGAYLGFKREKITFPVAVGSLPRQVPAQPWYLSRTFTMLIGGVLPFGAIFVELFFILTSLWLSQYYYVFGFLLLAFLIFVVTCAEIAIVLTYFQLCSEDYHWWWRSFLIPGASGLYVYLYSLFYLATRLDMAGVSVLLYMGYMFLASMMFGLMAGICGHLATFLFIKKIYAAVKVD